MEDVRLVAIRQREGQAFGIKQIVATIIGGGVLFMVGLFAYSKVGASIDQSGFTAAENTTMTNIKANIRSGFDLGSIMLIIAAVAGVVAILFSAFG